jgi:hypothetical protein
MKDNISYIKNILWYDINKNGYIKGCFNKQGAIYIYMRISNETPRYYIGSSNNLANRMSSHRSQVIS